MRGEADEAEAGQRRRSLLAILVVVALLAGGLLLVGRLSAVSRTQDCIASGARHCGSP